MSETEQPYMKHEIASFSYARIRQQTYNGGKKNLVLSYVRQPDIFEEAKQNKTKYLERSKCERAKLQPAKIKYGLTRR